MSDGSLAASHLAAIEPVKLIFDSFSARNHKRLVAF
jgi:hypothetical protein